MKLIAGLGNPGPRYRGTRHNLGFEVVEELARRHGGAFDAGPADALQARARTIGTDGAWLVKPLTFVNLSGRAIDALLRYYKIEVPDLLVIADDVNLPLGRLRARARGSAGGHNGLKSVIEALGTTEFSRLRIGVGRGDERRELADHVLAGFDPDERPVVAEAIRAAADAAEKFGAEGIGAVMNVYNRSDDRDEADNHNL